MLASAERAIAALREGNGPNLVRYDVPLGRIEGKLAEARAQGERAQDGSEEKARALRDVRRYEAFLAVGS